MDLHDFITAAATADLLPWAAQATAAARFGLTVGQVEEAALARGLMPARYQRNRQTITVEKQLRLFRSRAVIIGSGGLGGYLVEELARLGVGNLVVIDPDIFEEHNLNRQILSSPALLGRPKAAVAAARVAEINPAVTVTARQEAFSRDNGHELLAGAQIVMDGLDSIATRLELAESCRTLSIPLVHGAIGGWYGQVASQLPGDDLSPYLFGGWSEPKGVETRLGNPSFTPATVASLQVAEACKILLGEGESLRNRMIFMNLLDMEFSEVPLEPAPAAVGA
ncbi:HesA/MoeB/ThiF family protein [Geobacter pickeringii]|uniref:Thiamine biosynthesis protein ThiF n=1 Tax=Geobacter pickeringii TaxID=345632 RepID=A0A0B5BCD3_9BACT|nr:HesA/MoeB/ThiF family protein [Geobacter pickeringii]AJE02734.1 thiamine biosynthesis protein ThiF [Geobacter pickeringii]